MNFEIFHYRQNLIICMCITQTFLLSVYPDLSSFYSMNQPHIDICKQWNKTWFNSEYLHVMGCSVIYVIKVNRILNIENIVGIHDKCIHAYRICNGLKIYSKIFVGVAFTSLLIHVLSGKCLVVTEW